MKVTNASGFWELTKTAAGGQHVARGVGSARLLDHSSSREITVR